MRKKAGSTFPIDAIEARRFQVIQCLSAAEFDELRPGLDIWIFGSREFISQSQALRAIGRRAVLRPRAAGAAA
jgi:hypothetical protein